MNDGVLRCLLINKEHEKKEIKNEARRMPDKALKCNGGYKHTTGYYKPSNTASYVGRWNDIKRTSVPPTDCFIELRKKLERVCRS